MEMLAKSTIHLFCQTMLIWTYHNCENIVIIMFDILAIKLYIFSKATGYSFGGTNITSTRMNAPVLLLVLITLIIFNGSSSTLRDLVCINYNYSVFCFYNYYSIWYRRFAKFVTNALTWKAKQGKLCHIRRKWGHFIGSLLLESTGIILFLSLHDFLILLFFYALANSV